MKKLLAMVLALVMTLSLAVSASAVKADEKINEDYAEAVAVLNGMGVFKGYEDGSFKPENKITRAEVATIIYRIYTKDLAKNDKSGLYASYNKFSDMAGAGWAAGYIGYCANAEFVKGYPDGTFKPSGNVTGYEVLTMILRAIGYDKNNEFTGADWALNVAKYAEQAGVLKNVKGVDLNAPATRELVAELLFRAIAKAPMVTYTAAFGYQTVSFSGSKNDSKTFKDNETLGHKNFDLDPNPVNGTYGRPATKWTYNCGDKSTTVYDKPVATYTEEFKPCDLCKDLSEKKEAKVTVAYVDGVDTSAAAKAYVDTFKATDTKTALGAQGQLVEVYENEKGEDYTVIVINTYLAKVTKVIEEVKDKNDHVKVEASVNVDVYGLKDNNASKADNFETDGFKKGDFVLVTYDKGDIASMEAAKGEVAKLTGLKGNKLSYKVTNDVQDILAIAYDDVKVAVKATMNPLSAQITSNNEARIKMGDTYTFYYDSYGNVIGVGDYAYDADYVVIDRMWNTHNDGNGVVYANLVNVSDASVISKVVVDVVYQADGNEDTHRVSAIAADNDHFYEDLMTYTVNKDGEYELRNTGKKVQNSEDKDVLCTYDASADKYTINVNQAGKKNIYMDKDTEILFQYTETPDATYKAYTLDTLPDSFWGYVEYVVGSDGRADVVYVRGAEQTFSYVFIASTDYETRENADKSVTLTLKDAYYLNEDGSLGEKVLKLTSNSENVVISQTQGNTLLGSTKIDKAGLYKLYTLGENDQLLKYVAPETLEAVTEYSGKVVTGLYNNSKFFSVDDVKNFAWVGNFVKYDSQRNPQAAKLEQVEKNSELADLNAGDYVYVQLSTDGKDIVALHKVSFEVSVKIGDADAKYGYEEYIGQDFVPFTVDCAANQTVSATMNGVALPDPVVKDGKATITGGKVTGNIVVTVTTDVNTAIGKLASVKLDGETVDLATGYDTLAEALDHATNMNSAVSPQYVLTVTTKQNSHNSGAVWGNVQWASTKTAAANVTFDNDGELSTVTLTGANTGTYVVIRLSDFGDTAYYAYVIG